MLHSKFEVQLVFFAGVHKQRGRQNWNSSTGSFKHLLILAFQGYPRKIFVIKLIFIKTQLKLFPYCRATNKVLFSMISHLFCFPIQLEIKLFNSTDEDDFLSPVITQEFFSPGKIIPFISVFGQFTSNQMDQSDLGINIILKLVSSAGSM